MKSACGWTEGIFLLLLVFIAPIGAQSCPHEEVGLSRWSDKSEWTSEYSGGVIILDGNYLLDVITPDLEGVIIPQEYKLVFDHKEGVELRTIFLRLNGEFWIGSEDCPFEYGTKVTLLGPRSDNTHAGMIDCGTKTVCLPGQQSGEGAGRLEVHGLKRTPAWTLLSETALAGATTLLLDDPVEWDVGSKIAIATTDFWDDQTEERQVVAVSPNGRTVTLDSPLEFMHWGALDDVVWERAEVGLLSHRIVFQGDEQSVNDQFGGHMMALEGATVHIEGAEFYHMGQAHILGRYPIHFHLADSVLAGNSYVKHTSSYHTFNRCLTIHGTQHLLVEDFVGFDSVGHCIFLEEGAEFDNVLDHVLAMNPKTTNLTTSDESPSAFWITNAANTIRNCAGVGGTFGFWFSMPPTPLGPSEAIYPDIEPATSTITKFADNTAHSAHTCFMYDKRLETQTTVDGINVQTFLNSGGGWRSSEWSYHERLRAFKCRERAYWLIGLKHVWKDCQASDSPYGYLIGSTNLIVDGGAVVGYSHNKGNPPRGEYMPEVPASELSWYEKLWKDRTYPKMRSFHQNGAAFPQFDFRYCGWQQYDNNGPTLVKSVRFHNFFFDGMRPSSALCNGLGSGNVPGGVHHAINLTFTSDGDCLPPPLSAYIYSRNGAPTQGQLSHTFVDYDGSVSEMPGVRRKIVPNIKFLTQPGCVFKYELNAYSCPAENYGKMDIGDTSDPATPVGDPQDDDPEIGYAPNWRVYLYPLSRDPEYTEEGFQRLLGFNHVGNWLSHLQTQIIVNETYMLVFTTPTPTSLQLELRYVFSEDYVHVQIPYPIPDPASVNIRYEGDFYPIVTFSEATSLEELSKDTYFYDEDTGLLHIKLFTWRSSSQSTFTQLDPPIETFSHSGTRHRVLIDWKCNSGECCNVSTGHMVADGTPCSDGNTCWKGFCGSAPAGRINNGIVHPSGGTKGLPNGSSDPYGYGGETDDIDDPFTSRFLPDHCTQTFNIRSVGQSWSPSHTTIYEGDTVRWTFDRTVHNVAQVSNDTTIVYSGEGFYSGPVDYWSSGFRLASPFYQTFDTAGTYHYICEPHAALGMRGSITVVPRPVSTETIVEESSSITVFNTCFLLVGAIIALLA